ncbi:PspC domain-containing protein [Microbacterium lacus]|uniref:PspC domain-containing protein n=1 Tax=Microbacterium lacus TaxID=415217 RepID=UPI00384ADC4A
MTDTSTSAPPADPGPAPTPPPRPGGWDRFFSWVTDLGIARGDGWIGGVCAGLATRLGIDPIIVRGIFVVAALFGLPMFLVYAIGWALLPDLSGRIHLRELIERRFDPAMVGIGILLIMGLFPVGPWAFAAVPFGFLAPGGWIDGSAWSVLSTLAAVVVIGGIIFLIARSSSRRAASSGVSSVPDPRMASADPATLGDPALNDSGVSAPVDPTPGGAPASFGVVGSADTSSFIPPPAQPASSASDSEMAAWREQHAAWKVQDDAWRRQQQDAERAAREQARAERAATSAVFAAEAAERRRVRRASNPRTSFGYVVLVIGAALVIGAGAALWASAGGLEVGLAVAVGLFTGALVVGLSMVLAGAFRRRTGFLAFTAVALLFAGTLTGAAPIMRGIEFGSTYVHNYEPQSFTHLWGDLSIDVGDVGGTPEPIVIEQRGTYTYISITPGVIVDLEVLGGVDVEWVRIDNMTGEISDQGWWRASTTAGESGVSERISNRPSDSGRSPTRQIVELTQTSGLIYVQIYEN